MKGRKQARRQTTADGLPTFRGKPLFSDSITFAVTNIDSIEEAENSDIACALGRLISPPIGEINGKERSWFLIGFTDTTVMWGSFNDVDEDAPTEIGSKPVFDLGDDA